VLGLVGDPGAAAALALELADTELHCELDQRLPGARWCIEVMEGRLVRPPATDAQIVKAARKTLLDKGWDVVICLSTTMIGSTNPITSSSGRDRKER
jgi:hypothetical protein